MMKLLWIFIKLKEQGVAKRQAIMKATKARLKLAQSTYKKKLINT